MGPASILGVEVTKIFCLLLRVMTRSDGGVSCRQVYREVQAGVGDEGRLDTCRGPHTLLQAWNCSKSIRDLIFLSREGRDLGVAFQAPPGSQSKKDRRVAGFENEEREPLIQLS